MVLSRSQQLFLTGPEMVLLRSQQLFLTGEKMVLPRSQHLFSTPVVNWLKWRFWHQFFKKRGRKVTERHLSSKIGRQKWQKKIVKKGYILIFVDWKIYLLFIINFVNLAAY